VVDYVMDHWQYYHDARVNQIVNQVLPVNSDVPARLGLQAAG
jgi:hypothetical protein